MTVLHIFGIALSLISMVVLSIYSGKVARKSEGLSAKEVAGSIMGTLVGGSSTVGTAQLAYSFGMSAWWFTLGSGIACLILALLFAKPLHKSGHKTLIEFISDKYGSKNGLVASVLSSLGSFINIISQLVAATAIIAVVAPDLPVIPSLLISAAFMALYVIFGGTKGSGLVGILKMLLLYVSMLASGILVLIISKGMAGFTQLVGSIDNPSNVNFGSLFARGVGTDLGAMLSLVLGVITTQSYAQPIFAAKNTKSATRGALFSAALIPVVGIGGILVGLYMRATAPGISPKTALTLFVTQNMPPLLSGIVLGALFIAVVGTGAGLALGISTVIRRDILTPLIKKKGRILLDKTVERILIVALLFSACAFCIGPFGDTILKFAFMSMGLRGATLFAPLCFALWHKGDIDRGYVGAAIVVGPVSVLIFELWDILPFDPLFAGVAISLGIMFLGRFLKRKKSH